MGMGMGMGRGAGAQSGKQSLQGMESQTARCGGVVHFQPKRSDSDPDPSHTYGHTETATRDAGGH